VYYWCILDGISSLMLKVPEPVLRSNWSVSTRIISIA